MRRRSVAFDKKEVSPIQFMSLLHSYLRPNKSVKPRLQSAFSFASFKKIAVVYSI